MNGYSLLIYAHPRNGQGDGNESHVNGLIGARLGQPGAARYPHPPCEGISCGGTTRGGATSAA